MDTQHSHTVERAGRRMRVRYSGGIIADSDEALVLREGGGEQTVFFPRDSVEMGYLGPTETVTRHPGLGEAKHWTFIRDGNILEDAVFTYERPEGSAAELAGYLAFDASKGFEIYDVTEDDQGHYRHR